ncbi:aldo-keto reductase family 1 member C1-like isoform X2 [Narcine bancroftii]|uniref:aldo-keto reductase family 1 member C1-like isoform X2 n=1 Tax=Narcine bancroftii TaxID=1343680 RepID=UPI0038318803
MNTSCKNFPQRSPSKTSATGSWDYSKELKNKHSTFTFRDARCTVGCLLTGCIMPWFEKSTAQKCRRLQKESYIANSITGSDLPSIEDINVWMTYLSPTLVQKGLEETLKDVQLDYIDLYLVHWPMGLKPSENELFPSDASGKILMDDVDFRETWKVECHPYFNQNKLLKYCQHNNIVLVGYSPLGKLNYSKFVSPEKPILLNDPELKKIGDKLHKSVAQVVLRYQMQRGVVVIPKSFNQGRMNQNMAIFDFELTNEEMKTINELNKSIRYVTLEQNM